MKVELVFFLATALHGQFFSPATNADGSDLRFISSLGLASDPARVFRLYRYTPDRPETLFRAEDPFAAVQPIAPLLSDDGATRGIVTAIPCFGPCMFPVPRYTATLTRNGKNVEYRAQGNTLRLSRNGRWILDTGFTVTEARLFDTDTLSTIAVPKLPALHPTHAIANDSTITAAAPGGILLLEPKAPAAILLPIPEREVLSAAISPDGRKLFALTQDALYEFDRLTSARRTLHTSAAPLQAMSLSAAGDQVLLHTSREVLLIDGAGPRTLYTAPEPVTQVILSANGHTAYVFTSANRLIRLSDGISGELYPPFPSIAHQSSAGAVPGSLVRLSGGPFPDQLTVSVNGRAFPKVARASDAYEVQIPWDYPVERTNSFSISRPDSPFVISGELSLQRDPVAAIYTAPYQDDAKAVLADFSSLITPDNPAPAGSLIHFWVTGLGPANPFPPFACYILNGDAVRGLEIPFLGFAPGFAGVYQVDARIPANWPAGRSQLACTVGQNPPASYAYIYIRPN